MSRKNSSVLWNHFKKDYKVEKAICNICGSQLSYKSTSANLKNHLKRKHLSVYNSVFGEQSSQAETTNEISQSESDEDTKSSSWKCGVCKEVLEAGTDIMIEHMKKEHPNHSMEVEYQSEDDQNCYTEIIYLDEEEQTPLKESKPKPINRRRRTEDMRSKRMSSQNIRIADIGSLKASEVSSLTEDEEIFAKYIVTLLRTLPKDQSMKVQAEIVNMIVSTKLQCVTTAPNIKAPQSTAEEQRPNGVDAIRIPSP